MTEKDTRRAQVKTLGDCLIEVIAKQDSHNVALEALLATFTSVAIVHPCCASAAAQSARQAADLIEARASLPSATHFH